MSNGYVWFNVFDYADDAALYPTYVGTFRGRSPGKISQQDCMFSFYLMVDEDSGKAYEDVQGCNIHGGEVDAYESLGLHALGLLREAEKEVKYAQSLMNRAKAACKQAKRRATLRRKQGARMPSSS
jgi:hypothetical protein